MRGLEPRLARPHIAARPASHGIILLSLRFLLLLAGFIGFGAVLYLGVSSANAVVIGFVVLGWIVSLCLHESAHAFAAFLGGDRSVETRGYLSLDPMAYAQPMLTFGLPVMFVLLGGVGLPGGAVYIERLSLRSRWWDSLVAAAGPLANAVFLLAIGIPFWLDLPLRGGGAFWSALAFLGYLQATALALNLLPIPGFDGFGIIRPHLPQDMQIQADRFAAISGLLLLALIFIPQFGAAIRNASVTLTDLAGIDRYFIAKGYAMFRLFR
ncbi:MAG: site-2 protease family protein [Rhodoblastus sp.]